MDSDTVLEEVGGFGKFQIKILAFICIPVLFSSANTVSYVFISRTPLYRCYVPQCERFETTSYDQDWLSFAVPGSLSNEKFVPESCYKYNFSTNNTNVIIRNGDTCVAQLFGKEKEKCNSWIFSDEEYTMVNSWPEEMACKENEWKLALLGSSNFGGVMFGSAVLGFLADFYGRRKTFILALIFMSLTGIGQAVSTSYIMLMTFTFLNAAGTAGIYFSAFVLIVEMVDRNKREISAVLLNYLFTIGSVLVGVIAYLDPNWRNMTLWIAAPPIAFAFSYWFIPESICWLMTNKQYAAAYKVAKKAARENKKQLSASTIAQFEGTEKNSSLDSLNSSNDSEKKSQMNYIALLKSKRLFLRVIILSCVWATNSLVFYGLSLYSVNLSGNIYLNFIYGSLIEIPGNTIAWIAMNKYGRRYPLIISFILCGVGSMLGAVTNDSIEWMEITSFLISKMAISTSYTIASVFTAELMPTSMRSGCVGAFSTIARLSSLLAPFVPLLKNVHSALPLIVYGSFPLIAGVMSIGLPETFRCHLPDTLSDAENIGR